MTILILLLWLALVLLLARATWRAYRKGSRWETALLLAICAALLLFTGEYALFLGWSLLCGMGLSSCRL